jgi:8-oxo-dGTP pyrophosphatase MutT (NUDIX family)
MTEFQKSAGAILYYKEGKEVKFLLLKYPTYWGFAKGIIEKDEQAEVTAKREVEEETGLKDFEIIPGFEHKQEWFFRYEGKLIRKHAIYYLFKIKLENKDKVKLSHEHDDFAWVNLEDAFKKMRVKQNKEMLSKASKFIQEYEKQKRIT